MALLPSTVFCLILAGAACSDLVTYRIPNILPAALALAGLLLAAPEDAQAWAARLLSVAIVAAMMLAVYARRALGGGDVKLLIAAAVWIPPVSLPQFLMPLAVIGGLQALLTLGARMAWNRPGPALKSRMPYGVSIALAGCVWILARGLG